MGKHGTEVRPAVTAGRSAELQTDPREEDGFITLSLISSVWLSAFLLLCVQSVKFVFSLFQRFTVAIGFVAYAECII